MSTTSCAAAQQKWQFWRAFRGHRRNISRIGSIDPFSGAQPMGNQWTAYLASLEPSPFLRAVGEALDRQADLLREGRAMPVYLAGGAAVHFWTRTRVTAEIDAEFPPRFVPDTSFVSYVDRDGQRRLVHVDPNFNPMMSLLHEDYQVDALAVHGGLGGKGRLDVHVLAPTDLAVSKLVRWAEVDRQDVQLLAERGLLDGELLERRAREALDFTVGINRSLVEANVLEAIRDVRRSAKR